MSRIKTTTAIGLSIVSAAAITAFAVARPLWAQSANASTTYHVSLGQLNGSGATGQASLRLSANKKNLIVDINATGLEAGGPHVAHIHAVDSGDSQCPTTAQDTDHDGYVELAEGLVTYGPIRVDFMNIDPNQDGVVNFHTVVHLTGNEQILPLTHSEIVVHGMTVGAVGAGTPGEVNGMAGYKAVLPVLCGEIEATGTRSDPMKFRRPH
jgi:Cu/Zn superoxide dismutase